MTAALAITAAILSVLSFVMAGGTLVYVLARRFSTHEVRYEAPVVPETRYEYDLPPQWTDRDEAGGPAAVTAKVPSPLTMSASEYEKRERLSRMEAAFDEERDASDLNF